MGLDFIHYQTDWIMANYIYKYTKNIPLYLSDDGAANEIDLFKNQQQLFQPIFTF